MAMLSVCAIILMILNQFKAENMENTACQDKYKLLGSIYNEAKIVNAIQESWINLKCEFCTENVTGDKIWYFKQRGKGNPTNKMHKIISETYWNSNVTILDDGTLQLKRFHEIFANFAMASIFVVGTKNQWQEYKKNILDPINREFQRLERSQMKLDNYDSNLSFRVITVWDDWGPCFTNSSGIVVRHRIGRCFLHPLPCKIKRGLNQTSSHISRFSEKTSLKNSTSDLYNYFAENYDVSCYSIKLNNILPTISKVIRNVSEYRSEEICKEFNNSSIITAPVVVVIPPKNEFTYTTLKQIAENGHLTLMCPEIAPDSVVNWFKDDQLLGSSLRNNMAETEEEPHLTIDIYNSLYVLHATKNEEGVYTCIVDGRKVQNYTLKIVSKSKLLNDEFVRYSIYLCFVLTISLVCYCIGIFVAWTRRSSFADPLNLLNKGN